ncbi:Nn.00g005970.m01.CDS01 [Neocucurbitaria sp. VM-36]
MDETVRELHRDLERKFQRHGSRVEQMWRSLSQAQRKQILRDGSHDGQVLKNARDTSLGNVYKFIPEWNLHDITSPSSDFLLDILKHRATTPLHIQYTAGVGGGPGDHAHIVDMMQRKNLQLVNASMYKDCYTLFLDEETYGQSIKTTPQKKDEVLETLMPVIQAQIIVPQATGDLILMRQMHLLQLLNIVIEDILDTASSTRTQTQRPKKRAEVATAALAKLSLHLPPEKLELSHLINTSLDQKAALEDYINIISTEPTVLAHEVNLWFFTRPELVADEKGRTLPVHTDKYISGAVFDAVHGTVKAATVWNYITRLLALLKASSEKQIRAIVLQELSNTCHLEYMRAQALFKRHVSTGLGGSKWFKRMSTVRKDGVVRISMKRDPESLTVENPQLHYMLRLCQDDTHWSKDSQWLQKLEDLHRAHPLEKDKMSEREHDSLGDLAGIVAFMRSLSSVVQLPAVAQRTGQSFVSRYSALEDELRHIKSGLDLGDFAIPIDNLLEPGMADGALITLDHYILEKTGTKLGYLYQDLADDCVSNVNKRYEQQKAKASENKADAEYVVPAAPETPESCIQQRRQKEKTRPAHSSIYGITPEDTSATSSSQPAHPQQTFEVKASTSAVFSLLLLRSSAARGSISWDAFVAAMTDLSFSVVPKGGSIYTFVPPEKVAVQRELTLHRPHQSRIEGRHLLFYSRRLKQVYGWSDSTFLVT